MKGRSHRFPTHYHEPHDDWVDGSWTVDCVCGVNFDDGEEMVNCDECGVWVHTRCSRYVKGEESFICYKCKAKNDYKNKSRNYDDSEETEVAQLLVELPTKTITLEGSYAAGQGGRLRLWNDIPMEERVHVQGVPGGDPKLFKGLSSVFSPELWKCTGHVPKKFNFQYREFPSWDEDSDRNQEGNDNTVDKGAGVLFSLSKESLQTPVTAFGGLRGQNEEGRLYRNVRSRDPEKGREGKMEEERNLSRSVSIHSGETKKEDLGTRRDPSSKKRALNAEKEADGRKRSPHTYRTAFTSTSDAKSLEFYGDRDSKSFKTDGQSSMSLTEPVTKDYDSTCYVAAANGMNIPENNISLPENLPSSVSRHNSSTVAGLEVERNGLEVPARSSPIDFDVTTATFLEHNAVGSVALKREGEEVSNSNPFYNAEGSACNDLTLPNDKLNNFAPGVKSNLTSGDGNRSKVKAEASDNRPIGLLTYESSPADILGIGLLSDNPAKNPKTNDALISGSPASNLKAQEVDGNSEAVGTCHTNKTTCNSSQPKQDVERSESPVAEQKHPIETNCNMGSTDEFSKSDGNTSKFPEFPAFPTQHKIALSVGKPHFTSSMVMISKTSPDSFRSADAPNSDSDTKQQASPDCSTGFRKDQIASDVTRAYGRPDLPGTTTKEHLISYLDSSKVSDSIKILHASVPRRMQSDSKDVLYSSAKASSAHNSCESARSLQNESSSHIQNKSSTSAFPSKGEKFSQSNSHSSSKGNHSLSMNPSATTHSPATISDEELALLLHQQLNSSPRVPRVPRVPHLTSPTATSILTKRSSSSGAKEHNPFLRRKCKHASKFEYRRAHEIDAETKRTGRMLSPPDRRKQDTGYSAADALPKMEGNGSPTAIQYVKKNYPPASTSTGNSGPSSSAEVNDHHMSHNSSRDISDEDTGTVRVPVQVPVHRTLPSLISEIMSKGRRMTYEELCNAVLPHWPNLRKHNGERYAYSSHSQAVLDCLRNRHEWARLVDRGPKTNPSRKRRKFDNEESEDNDFGRGRCVKEGDGKSIEAQREEFPKGKRKARKRRRLALQGRGIKDVRKRRKAELVTDDDDDSGQFSNSSEESLFSEDEIQDSGASSIQSKSSAGSDEAETT